MISRSRVAIIGEVLLDVTLASSREDHKMRLGGVVHAARAAWAANYEYELFYIAPEYLKLEIEKYAYAHGCQNVKCIGTVVDSSNVILINDVKELADQGYSIVMSEKIEIPLETIVFSDSTNKALIFPGSFNLNELVLEVLASTVEDIYLDIANGIDDLNSLEILFNNTKKIRCVFNSTSTNIKLNGEVNFKNIKDKCIHSLSEVYLMKESRGGGVLYSSSGIEFSYPAFLGSTSHSVGVGDCFDIIFCYGDKSTEYDMLLRRSSFLAAQYASTSFPDDLKKLFSSLEINESILHNLSGVRIPWEKRQKIKIYIAAPDFDWVDDTYIRMVERSLIYHNFVPLLPIKLNGQINDFTDISAVSQTFEKDINLIIESDIILAIIINDDHGTLIEIGYAKGIGKPVIVFDPYHIARNPMLTQLPDMLDHDFENILNEVYKIASRQ